MSLQHSPQREHLPSVVRSVIPLLSDAKYSFKSTDCIGFNPFYNWTFSFHIIQDMERCCNRHRSKRKSACRDYPPQALSNRFLWGHTGPQVFRMFGQSLLQSSCCSLHPPLRMTVPRLMTFMITPPCIFVIVTRNLLCNMRSVLRMHSKCSHPSH